MPHAGRQHGPHAGLQQRVVAVVGLAQAAQLRQRDGALGQAFEDQGIEPAALGQGLCRVDAVAGIAGAGADAQGFHGRDDPIAAATRQR